LINSAVVNFEDADGFVGDCGIDGIWLALAVTIESIGGDKMAIISVMKPER